MDVILIMKPQFTFPDPPKNWSFNLAKTLDEGNALDREIVTHLVGRPHRFSELEPLLAGRGKNNLTQALKRLQLEGIIHMRTNFRVAPPYDYYELTFLGIRVVLALAGREYVDHIVARSATMAQGTG